MSGVAAGAVATLTVIAVSARLHRVAVSQPRPIDRLQSSRVLPQIGRAGTSGAVAVILVASAVVIGPGPTMLLAGSALAWTASRTRRAGRACRAAIEATMPDAIELLVMSLHAGYSPTQAIARLATDAPAPVRPAFDAVERRLHRGNAVADALGELTTACGRCALPLVNAMSAAVRDGLPLAPVLDRLTDEANASRRRHGEAAARRLPVRLSFPLVVCTLPSFVLLAIAPAVLGALSTLQGTTP